MLPSSVLTYEKLSVILSMSNNSMTELVEKINDTYDTRNISFFLLIDGGGENPPTPPFSIHSDWPPKA